MVRGLLGLERGGGRAHVVMTYDGDGDYDDDDNDNEYDYYYGNSIIFSFGRNRQKRLSCSSVQH